MNQSDGPYCKDGKFKARQDLGYYSNFVILIFVGMAKGASPPLGPADVPSNDWSHLVTVPDLLSALNLLDKFRDGSDNDFYLYDNNGLVDEVRVPRYII